MLGVLSDTEIRTGLDSDRYSFAESLVERGTFLVKGSSMYSVDWIRVQGEFYSGKPPVLNFAGAGLYALLHHGFGLSFREHPATLVRAFVWVFALLPSVLSVALLYRLLRRVPRPLRCDHGGALLVTALFALTTLVPAYATIFTNHSLAMMLVLLALMAILPARMKYAHCPRALLWAGFWATLSMTVDLLPGTFFVFGLTLGLLFLPVSGRTSGGEVSSSLALPARLAAVGWLALGCLGPFTVHLILNRLTLGTWTLPYLIPGAYDYEGSVFVEAAANPDYDQFPTYPNALFHYLVGHRGLIWFMPLLVVGGWIAARLIPRRRAPVSPALRMAAFAMVVSLVITVLLVPRFSMGLAGGTYGNRHLIPLLPGIYLFLALLLRQWTRWGVLRRAGLWITVIWSAGIATLGVLNPWAPQTLSVFAPAEVLVQRSARYGRFDWAEWISSQTSANAAFGYGEYAQQLANHLHVEEAIYCLRQSVRLDPKRVQSWYNLGYMEGSIGREEYASQAFAEVVKLDPANAGARANLSLSLARQGRFMAAYVESGKALQLNPTSRAALKARASSAQALGFSEEATTVGQRLTEILGQN